MRRTITIGHWDRRNSNMTEHFIRLVNEAKYLDPPLAEGHIITSLARHFSPEIERSMWTAGIGDIPAAITFLRRMDGTTQRQPLRGADSPDSATTVAPARPVATVNRPMEQQDQQPAQSRDLRQPDNRNENWRTPATSEPRRDNWRDRRPDNSGGRSPHPYNTRQNRQINAITVEHCKGKDNIVRDTLSRYPPGAKTYDSSVNAQLPHQCTLTPTSSVPNE